MGDPELRSDEKILLRTPGIYVKSIPFEGILTNKRIILVDKATNLLPQKEIPLVTIRDIEGGENAIRDQTITLTVLLRSGEKRQMILTFSRQAGGNRIKERDAWLKALKEFTSSGFEQVVRKVIPGREQPPKKPKTSSSPRIRVIGSPQVQDAPVLAKIPGKKEREGVAPVKKIVELPPVPASPEPQKNAPGTSSPRLGTYCSRCGNRVPEGSGYCNRCGSKIFVAPNLGLSPISPQEKPQLPEVEETATIWPVPRESGMNAPLSEPFKESVPTTPLWAVQQEPDTPADREPASLVTETPPEAREEIFAMNDEISGTEQPSIIDSQYPKPPPERESPVPRRPWDGFSFKPGKKAVIGIVVVIIVIAAILGGFYLYPLISGNSGTTPDTGASYTTQPAIVKNSGAVIPVKSLIPVVKTTRTVVPGNSPANVGF